MTIETEIAALTVATTDLITEVVDQKDTLAAQVTASAGSASAAAASAADAAVSASNAAAVVTGGTASLTPAAGLIPLADGTGKIANGWLPNNPAFSGEIAANGGIALGDNDKATFGAGDDLEIYHDGSNSYIKNSGTGNLYIQDTDYNGDVYIQAQPNENSIIAYNNSSVVLFFDNAQKIMTTATGIDVTGTVTADGLTVDGNSNLTNTSAGASAFALVLQNQSSDTSTAVELGFDNTSAADKTSSLTKIGAERVNSPYAGDTDLYFKTQTNGGSVQRLKIATTGDISFYEDTGTTAKLTWSGAGEDLNFADNVKATFGASDDLQIYSDGSTGIIQQVGTGVLLLKGQDFYVQNDAGENFIRAETDASVRLYHNNLARLDTTATGIDVTGTATMDGLTVSDGTETTSIPATADRVSFTGATSNFIQSSTSLFVQPTGDLVLNGTGSEIMRLKSSKVGINNSNPATALDVTGTVTADGLVVDGNVESLGTFILNNGTDKWQNLFSTNDLIIRNNHNTSWYNRLQISYDGNISFYEDTGTTPKFVWSSSAESLGIGSSPSTHTLELWRQGGDHLLLGRAGVGTYELGISSDNALTFEDGGSERLRVNATGIDVTGSVTADGVTSDGNITLGAGDKLQFNADRYFTPENNIDGAEVSANGIFRIKTGTTPVARLLVNGNGDISFFEDTGSSPKFFWDASDESLGIGTSSPTGKLSINGSASINGFDVGAILGVGATNASSPYFVLGDQQGVALRGVHTGTFGRKALAFYTSNNTDSGDFDPEERMRIDSSGNVGIGYTTINTFYDTAVNVFGSANSVIQFQSSNTGTASGDGFAVGVLNGAATDAYIWNRESSNLLFGTGSSERMRIDSSGNVGIGTSSPDTLLEIVGADPILTIRDTETAGASTNATLRLAESGASDTLNDYWDINYTGLGALAFKNKYGASLTERLRIDSSGRVGIGTTSPSAGLQVAKGSSTIPAAGASTSSACFGNDASDDNYGVVVGANSNGVGYISSQRTDGTATTYNLSIQPNGGNVGIGTSLPSAILQSNAVAPTYTDASTVFFGSTTNNAAHNGIMLSSYGNALGGSVGSNLTYANSATPSQTNTGRSSGEIQFSNTTGSGVTSDIKFGGYVKGSTTYTERARLTSDGSLLVGTTDNSPVGNNVAGGIGLFPNGSGQFSRDGGTALLLNRKTSDGEILRLNRDGSIVGSIGTSGGDLTVGTGDTGLAFLDGGNFIAPWNTSTNAIRDAAVDLGTTSGRFKDLYLSGGVYLGGTGAANKLDDYEEGTFTPALTFGGASVGLTYYSQLGRYTKVGRQVTVQIAFYINSKGSSTGAAVLSGLPFFVTTQVGGFSSYSNIVQAGGFSTLTGAPFASADENSSNVVLRETTATGFAALTEATFNDSCYMMITMTYFT